MSYPIRQRVTGIVVVMLVFLALAGAVAHRSLRALHESSHAVARSHETLVGLERLHSELKSVEASARGYALTRDEAFDASYRAALRRIPERLAELRALRHDGRPEPQVDRIALLVRHRVALSDSLLLAAEGGANRAAMRPLVDRGRESMDALEAALETLRAAEQRRLASRDREELDVERRNGVVLATVALLAIVFAGLATWHLQRDFEARQRAEAEVRLLQTLGTTIAGTTDFADALQAALMTICRATGWALGQAWVPTADGARLERAAEWHEREGLRPLLAASQATTFARGEGVPGRVWAAGVAEWMRDASTDPNFIRSLAAAEAGLHATVAVPVIADGEVVAVLEFFVQAVRDADERFIAQLSAAAAQLGMLLQRRRTEEALHESEQRFRGVLENLRACAVVLDERGRVVFANDYLLALVGMPRDQAIGADWFTRFVPADASMRATFEQVLATGDVRAHHENDISTADGGRRRIAWDNVLVHAPDGRVVGIASVGQDVTERRQLEERLRQAQKMEAIGQLAGGIAHDFNNLLTAIGCSVEFLEEQIPPGHPARADVDQVREAASRAAALTRQLLAFARRQVLQPRPVDLDEVVAGVHPLLQRVIGPEVDVRLALARSPGLVMADAGQMEQVLMNLVINARDAMPAGGVLVIATAHETVVTARPHRHGVLPPGEYVTLTVRDTGAGMDESTLEHLFEPFFTTKPQGKGTGLGLAMVHGIIAQSGGQVTVESTPGFGTTFVVYLPVVVPSSAPGSAATAGPGAEPGPARPTVLLVDDEPAVRAAAARVLEREGFAVVVAEHGRDALDALAARLGDRLAGAELPPLVVLTDVKMPVMGGRELAQAIDRRYPGVPVIFMSGFASADVWRDGMLDGRPFIHKPFTLETLVDAVQKALGMVQPEPGA